MTRYVSTMIDPQQLQTRLLKEVSLVRMHEVFFCGRVTKATGNKMSCHTCIILELSAAYKITLFK